MGDCSHSDPKSQPYLLCNNLEKLNGNKKSVVYQKTKKNVFIYKESICSYSLSLNQITTIDLLKF